MGLHGQQLVIGPDAYHKDNISGGPWYAQDVPCSTIDAPLKEAPWQVPFIDYLRLSFQAGGFPGASRVPLPLREVLPEFIPF